MTNSNKLTIDNIKEYLIFEYIGGSHLYGTNIASSDIDKRGIFIAPLEMILNGTAPEQISDETNDITYYELRRYLSLLSTNNPNVIESLGIIPECILYKHPIMDMILDNKDKFITKLCRNTFIGYAISQIQKSRGYNKKMNWEEERINRKTVLDFCYILLPNGGSATFHHWAKHYGRDIIYDAYYNEYFNNSSDIIDKDFSNYTSEQIQKFFGLAGIDHARDTYDMYLMPQYDDRNGIVSDTNKANDVQLLSIPKGSKHVVRIVFNKDGYTTHCKDYKSYQTWIKERNNSRYNINKSHGKQYDSKNAMHLRRLCITARDIAIKGNVIMRRSSEEIKELLSIRLGEKNYEDLLLISEKDIKEIETLFEQCNLPNKVDEDFRFNLEYKMRQSYYNLK